jgi:hypothetical protein
MAEQFTGHGSMRQAGRVRLLSFRIAAKAASPESIITGQRIWIPGSALARGPGMTECAKESSECRAVSEKMRGAKRPTSLQKMQPV